MRLLWLPEVLRAAGLEVTEWPGWQTRGGDTFDPVGIICHATAGSSTSTDAGEIGVLLNGSETAPPPIAQLYLSRTGKWFVIASGRCNHALTGWGGPLKGYGNAKLVGIEAANDNRGQPWPQVQVDAYQRGVAAICRRMGWADPGRHVAAHREHQPYPPPEWTRSSKSDPHGIDMNVFRARVSALLAGGLEDEMFDELQQARLNSATERAAALLGMKPTVKWLDPRDGKVKEEPNELAAQIGRIETAVAGLADRPAPGTVVISDEQLERVLRRVLGSVDGATPPTQG